MLIQPPHLSYRWKGYNDHRSLGGLALLTQIKGMIVTMRQLLRGKIIPISHNYRKMRAELKLLKPVLLKILQ